MRLLQGVSVGGGCALYSAKRRSFNVYLYLKNVKNNFSTVYLLITPVWSS